MSTTVHDPVCHMDIDPATATGTSEYKARPTISVSLAAKSHLMPTPRNILGSTNNILTKNILRKKTRQSRRVFSFILEKLQYLFVLPLHILYFQLLFLKHQERIII